MIYKRKIMKFSSEAINKLPNMPKKGTAPETIK